MICTNGEHMIFENILYIPKLKTIILRLGKLDSQDCDICLRNGFFILHNGQGRLFTKSPKASMEREYVPIEAQHQRALSS